MKDLSNTEPNTMQEGFWLAQPRWVRILTMVVGLPVWIGWAFMVVTGAFFDNQSLALGMFAVFGIVVLTQMFFIARAFWKLDL